MKQNIRLILTAFLIIAASALNVQAQWELVPSFPAGPKATIGSYIFASNDLGLWVSNDSGANWKLVDSGLNGSPYLSKIIQLGANVFALNSSTGVFRSTDSGISWVAVDSGLSDQTQAYTDLTVKNSNLFLSSNRGVYRSSNSGASWVTSDLVPADNDVSSLAANDSYVFALVQGVYRSSNDGATWEPANNGLGTNVTNLTAIAGSLFAGTYGYGVYRSNDNGSSWSSCNNGLTNLRVNVITGFDSLIFAGTDGGGVFISTNNGLTWQSANLGLLLGKDTLAYSIGNLSMSEGYLFAESLDDAVRRRKMSEMITTSVVSVLPIVPSDIQSYPNPFSQSTTITFTTPENGAMEVSVVNLLGSPVARLFEGELAAGEHSFTWDARRGMPPGMYECVVRMNGRVERVPVMVTK